MRLMRPCQRLLGSSVASLCLFFILGAGTSLAADSCRFTGMSSLAFGNLDVSSTANAVSTMTMRIQCSGNPTWLVGSDNGLHYSGATKRMKHQTLNDYIPYTLTFAPTTGGKWIRTITGSGTVLNGDYVNASAGSYSDSVRVTITP